MKLKNASAAPDPKILAQGATTLVVFALAYFGIELDPELAGAISLILGFLAGYIIRPAATVPDIPEPPVVARTPTL